MTICCAACAGAGPFGDPFAAARSLGDVAADEIDVSDFCPFPVYPSSVERLKQRLHPSFVATNDASGVLKGSDLVGWGLFFASWLAFYQEDVSIWGTGAQCQHAANMAVQLNGWRRKIRAAGGNPGGEDPGALKGGGGADSAATLAKWIAIGVVGAGVVYGLTLAAPFISAAAKR